MNFKTFFLLSIVFSVLFFQSKAQSPDFFLDINPSGDGLLPDAEFVNLNGTIYFVASDGTFGTELWKTDGTAGGTRRVADISAGPDSSLSFPGVELTPFAGALYLSANDDNSGRELRVVTPRQSIGAVERIVGDAGGTVFHDEDEDQNADRNQPVRGHQPPKQRPPPS